jgi:murein DD-endopeptidase MepM/ murein hydrolase activator NlpD
LSIVEAYWVRCAEGAARTATRHRRGLVSIGVAALSGFAITAFGIAPIAPDAADLPRRMLTHRVDPADLPAQLEALAAHELVLSRTELTRPNDNADALLRRLGIFDASLATFMRANNDARRLFEGKPGKQVQARVGTDGAALELVARFAPPSVDQQLTHFTRVTIDRAGGGWRANSEVAPLSAQLRIGSGTIQTSLFAATDAAALSDSIAVQLVELFSGDIDFHRQLRRGDTFGVVYETLTADEQPIAWGEGIGRILAAEFINAGKVYQALWYSDGSGKGSYFGFDGQSRRRAFLASPMAFSRVTSGFSMRVHPMTQSWRAHLGVDYSAPLGTSVRSVGDGWVEFVGWQNGYGNVARIAHGNEKSTLYAHLSRVDVRRGQRVEQGQQIGAVGATGWATGPHLHFEFRVNGKHQDPAKVARAAEPVVISASARPRFEASVRGYGSQLELAESLRGYRGFGE